MQFRDDEHKAVYNDLVQRSHILLRWIQFAAIISEISMISRMAASIPMLWLLHGRPARA